MGDPKKPKKKYETPTHPWQKERIEEEKVLTKEYGLRTKKEIWKANSILRGLKNQSKNYASMTGEQMEKQKELFLQKLVRLGILGAKGDLDDVLGLELKDILERRLQTLVVRKKLTSTMMQARQFIVHNHIAIGKRKISVPGYLVKKDEEKSIVYAQTSSYTEAKHPEIQGIKGKK